MDVVETIDQVRRAVCRARQAGRTIGFVPTMGALHAGHASLIDIAASRSDLVVVSIFVNPTQFGPTEDLAKYPRTPEADLATCQAHGANLVFMPPVSEMYQPGGNLTTVSVSELGNHLCGASRPGHFAGVCTVVAKLFNIVLPDKAFFGAKDFQQASIIRRMVADLNFPVEVVVCPTVRESDGLAMSSRNVYLTSEHRKAAPALYAALTLAAGMIRQGAATSAEVISAAAGFIKSHAPDAVIDYIEIVDLNRLAPVAKPTPPVAMALAVKFGGTRLIDNIVVD